MRTYLSFCKDGHGPIHEVHWLFFISIAGIYGIFDNYSLAAKQIYIVL